MMVPPLFLWRGLSLQAGSARHEFASAIPLKIEKPGQVGMVQLQLDLLPQGRFAVEGNTKAGARQHRQIVRAVANRRGR